MLYLVVRLSDKKIVAVTELRDLADMIADAFPVPCGVYNFKTSRQDLNDYFY